MDDCISAGEPTVDFASSGDDLSSSLVMTNGLCMRLPVAIPEPASRAVLTSPNLTGSPWDDDDEEQNDEGLDAPQENERTSTFAVRLLTVTEPTQAPCLTGTVPLLCILPEKITPPFVSLISIHTSSAARDDDTQTVQTKSATAKSENNAFMTDSCVLVNELYVEYAIVLC